MLSHARSVDRISKETRYCKQGAASLTVMAKSSWRCHFFCDVWRHRHLIFLFSVILNLSCSLLWQYLLKFWVMFNKLMFVVVVFWSCSKISIIFIWSYWLGQVNNPHLNGYYSMTFIKCYYKISFQSNSKCENLLS